MQCPNCQFENMPGSKYCARCDTLLDFSSAKIDVHPPRSSWKRTATTTVTWHRNGLRRMFDRISDFLHPGRILGNPFADVITFKLLLRLLIPGWPQFFLGRRIRGRIFLFGYIVLLLPALALLGTNWGLFFLGLCVSLHASSITDAFGQPNQTFFRSLLLGVCAYVGVIMLIYYPIGWAFQRHFQIQNVYQNFDAIREGDVIWTRTLERYNPGDVVIYNRGGNRRIDMGTNRNRHRMLQWGGLAVDRVLAEPGDHVSFRNNRIYINDTLSTHQPVRGVILPTYDVTVPAKHVLIIPSNVQDMGDIEPQSLPNMMLIRQSDIQGCIVFRSYPWSRFGAIGANAQSK